MERKTIKVKYIAHNGQQVKPIRIIDQGDWIDLRAAVDVTMRAGEYRMIPLGVAIELPEGYEALVVPRSSAFKNFRILQANGIGVIDESYCGDADEWHQLAYAVDDTVIKRNDRICQFRIIRHQPEIEIEEVESLGNASRGGIGSTGVR